MDATSLLAAWSAAKEALAALQKLKKAPELIAAQQSIIDLGGKILEAQARIQELETQLREAQQRNECGSPSAQRAVHSTYYQCPTL